MNHLSIFNRPFSPYKKNFFCHYRIGGVRPAIGMEPSVLIIRCAACKKKLWRYDKIGPGEVLRCHKNRIARLYEAKVEDGRVRCPCGKDIGIDKGNFYKMIAKGFTYSGTKRSN